MTDNIASQAAKALLDTQSVLFNAREPFHYTSGNIGPVYVDCRRPLSFPDARETLMRLGEDLIKAKIPDIDIIAGAETAGIPYAALLASRLHKPMVYVRKKPKGHGRMSQIEGYFEEGITPNVLLVEDLQNFGHSKKIFVDALREAGAKIENFFVLFDYGIRADVTRDNKDMGLTQHHLCNWHDIVAAAREGSYFDEDTLSSVESYLNDPATWEAEHSRKKNVS